MVCGDFIFILFSCFLIETKQNARGMQCLTILGFGVVGGGRDKIASKHRLDLANQEAYASYYYSNKGAYVSSLPPPSLIRSASVARISLSVLAFQTINAAIILLAIKGRQQQLEESPRRIRNGDRIDSTSSTFLGI